ncbi:MULTISPECIES: hypothetical protein [Halomonadaceae]|jgi:hypothetical protein|uniref:hypothetical protein n=1 Tax=Halomonadaceae TaxID=28256 RepID=UPI0039BFEDDD|tara:strand:- start:1352 stop:1522 length:171 start_codon:yes stop_codon:yes gene_type:complete
MLFQNFFYRLLARHILLEGVILFQRCKFFGDELLLFLELSLLGDGIGHGVFPVVSL